MNLIEILVALASQVATVTSAYLTYRAATADGRQGGQQVDGEARTTAAAPPNRSAERAHARRSPPSP